MSPAPTSIPIEVALEKYKTRLADTTHDLLMLQAAYDVVSADRDRLLAEAAPS